MRRAACPSSTSTPGSSSCTGTGWSHPRSGRCAEHLDVRYAGVVSDGADFAVSDESLDVAWWPAEALPEESAGEIGPMVEAARRLLG